MGNQASQAIHFYFSNGEILAGIGIALRYAAIVGRIIDKMDTHLRNVEQILRELHQTVKSVSSRRV